MKQKTRPIILITCLLLAGLALLGTLAQASTSEPDYGIVFSSDAPAAGRAAPYGQYIITHNGVSITSTEQLGTVARTNGYDPLKAIMCDTGAYPITVTLYARISSTGDLYTITEDLVAIPANTPYITTINEIAPWMSLGLTSEVTGSTTTCGVYVQTP